jgi:transposase
LKSGKWHPVAECLSRWARIRLLRILLDGLSQKEIAKACGTSPQAVFNWIHRKTHHPSDRNAVVLLGLAWRRNRDEVRDILKTEAKRYLKELWKIGVRPGR